MYIRIVSDYNLDNESNTEEHIIYEILKDIHIAFFHLRDIRETLRKALPKQK